MALDFNFTLNTIYPAASAAYLIMSLPPEKLALPAGYDFVGTIEANAKEAAAAIQGAIQSNPKALRIVNSMIAENNIFGFVAYNQAEQTAIVAIRGSETIWDWIDDLDAVQVPFAPNPNVGLVHMGFHLVFQHVRGDIRRFLNDPKCAGLKKVIVTGHSLGAAVAMLASFDIAENIFTVLTPELYTWAGPRTLNDMFGTRYTTRIPKWFRIVNHLDLVPNVPLPPLYTHVGEEVLVDGGFKIFDPSHAHHLTTYLAGVQKLARSAPAVAAAAGPVGT